MQKSGVYGTLKEQDTQWTHTGKENGKMKKLIALLLALIMVFSLVACSGCLLYTSDAADE